MSDPSAEIIELGNGRFLVEIEDRPDALGPLTRRELLALYEALEEWVEEGEY